jgi:hypothetical protein
MLAGAIFANTARENVKGLLKPSKTKPLIG